MQLTDIIETTAARLFDGKTAAKLFLPDIADALKQRYRFVDSPDTVDKFRGQGGLVFGYGAFEDFIIDEMTIFNDAIIVRSAQNSNALDRVIDSVLDLLSEEFGISLKEQQIRHLYNSKIEVKAAANFSGLFPALNPIVERLRATMLKNGIEISGYETAGFSLDGHGPNPLKPGKFVFERRAGQPFQEEMFYTEAPLSSDEHLAILEELEDLF